MDSLGNIQQEDSTRGRGNRTLSRVVDEMRAGNIKPTHFLLLSCKFRRGIDKGRAAAVRRQLFKTINNIQYTHAMGDDEDPLRITWKCRNSATSMLYYTMSRFEETYVRQLTKGLLRGTFQYCLQKEELNENDVRVDFLVTKNINYNIDLITNQTECLGNVVEPRTPLLDLENLSLVNPDLSSSDTD